MRGRGDGEVKMFREENSCDDRREISRVGGGGVRERTGLTKKRKNN